MPRSACLLLLVFTLFGCSEERPRGGSRRDASQPSDAGRLDAGLGTSDAGDSDGGPEDAAPGDSGSALDAGRWDSGASDSAVDAGEVADTGLKDTGPLDTGAPDLGLPDAGPPDTGAPDLGLPDAGPPDAGAVDAGPAPVTCNEPGLVTRTISDSASSGTPDTYFFDVNPGDPFCAQITGGGSGRWGVTVSNGTSSGIYCSNTTPCRIRVASGDPTLLVTAQTTDIGSYALTVQSIPR